MTSGAATGAGNEVLARNLLALGMNNRALAERLAETAPHAGVAWVETAEGLSATLCEEEGVVRALASKRAPLAEARAWAEQIDLGKNGAVVVRGFGLGHHLAALAQRAGGNAAVFVFEPDVGVLRAALERIDHSAWLGRWTMILTDAEDTAAIAAATGAVEPLIAMGTQIADHGPSVARLGARGNTFLARFTGVVSSVRMNVVTAFMQTEATIRNFLQNIDHYVTCEGLEGLRGVLKGRPAITVASGPSLERNVELLTDPRVRERFVIIAAQTVLRPLLARGIRPHFVTSLDFHEISRRFFEGLTREDVEGVTLVIEPKVNPAVPAAFPGVVRCAAAPFLDGLLGEKLARPMGEVTAGATVAHLSYYLARFLGCEPVTLIGQDLGFTDGQYYPAGAAIHDVWAGELNEFKTLEMLEWQRIKRHSHILRRVVDDLGRPMYTDEQMHSYLVQFNRDFKADAQRGLTVIDATEGGVKKESVTARTLAEVIRGEMGREREGTIEELLAKGKAAAGMSDSDRRMKLRAVAERLRELRHDAWRVGELCRRAAGHLIEAREHHADQERVNKLIVRLEKLREQVKAIEPAWGMVTVVNQMGAFKRYRADRLIAVDEGKGAVTALEKQRRQIERDLTNVEWLGDAADALTRLLEEAGATLAGGARVTRDPAGPTAKGNRSGGGGESVKTVAAVVMLDLERSGLGVSWDPGRPVLGERTALSMTLERLGRCKRLERIVVVSSDPAAAQRLADPLYRPTMTEFVKGEEPAGTAGAPSTGVWPAEVRGAARLFAMHGWRGGLGDWTVYDEVFDPAVTVETLGRLGMDAALVVGADWWLVDPELVDAVIERYMERPEAHRFTFAHAGPGLSGCVVDRKVAADLVKSRATAGSFASLGGVLGYVPTHPLMDMIAKSMCVSGGVGGATPGVRDLLVRCTADTPARAQWVLEALRAAGLDPRHARAGEVAGAIGRRGAEQGIGAPAHLALRLVEGGKMMSEGLAGEWVRRHAAGRADCTVTLVDAQLEHPGLLGLIELAKQSGVPVVHVRTDLSGDAAMMEKVYGSGAGVISVDMHGASSGTFARLAPAGTDWTRSRQNLSKLLALRHALPQGLVGVPWIVPRLTRCDGVYAEIEGWYDHWMMTEGWAVIDALCEERKGERIGALPLPRLARRRNVLENMTVGVEGVERRSEWPA